MTSDREAEERAAVVASAMTWCGTPFHHMGFKEGAEPVKGGGIDCAHLVRAAFIGAGVVAPFDAPLYPAQWHLHRDEERYLEWLGRFAVETQIPRPATVAIWQFGRCFSHAGVLVDAENVVHAYQDTGYVTVDPVRAGFLSVRHGAEGVEKRPIKLFDVWDRRGIARQPCAVC